MTQDKIWDEVYTVEIFTWNGQRHVCLSRENDSEYVKSFKTREELNNIIAEYIADSDYLADKENSYDL